MTVYEVLTIALIGVLAVATTVAIWLGLLGWMGQLHVVRCGACDHTMFATVKDGRHECARCRHPLLMHPLHSARHPLRPLGS